MKKIIVVLLTLLMITAVLTACGKAQDQPTESNDASADTSAKTTETIAVSATQTTSNSSTKLSQPEEVTTTANVTSNGAIDASKIFSDRDRQIRQSGFRQLPAQLGRAQLSSR